MGKSNLKLMSMQGMFANASSVGHQSSREIKLDLESNQNGGGEFSTFGRAASPDELLLGLSPSVRDEGDASPSTKSKKQKESAIKSFKPDSNTSKFASDAKKGMVNPPKASTLKMGSSVLKTTDDSKNPAKSLKTAPPDLLSEEEQQPTPQKQPDKQAKNPANTKPTPSKPETTAKARPMNSASTAQLEKAKPAAPKKKT